MDLWALEGNVSCGKSTFLEEICRRPESNFEAIFERVEDFATFKSFNPLYEAYDCPERAASISQLHILNCIHRQLYDIAGTRKQKNKTLITERSMYSPLVFNRAHENVGTITPFVEEFVSDKVTQRASETTKALNVKYVGVIYLHTEIGVCLQRIAQRGRYNEKECVTSTFLAALERQYGIHLDTWREELGPRHVHILVTAGKSPSELVDEFLAYIFGLSECT